MRTLRYNVLSDSPISLKNKKFAPSLTGYINPQSSQQNNVKMTITNNSAYVQTETSNFTFAQ